MPGEYSFEIGVEWLGDRGAGTASPRSYGREHRVVAPGKPSIEASAARAFHGDASRWNPEEELIAALAQCHLLSYLYAATSAGVNVVGYADQTSGRLEVEPDGSGRIVEVVLRPVVTIAAGGDPEAAAALHSEAHRLCFVANSVSFPVSIEPETLVAQ